MSVAVGLESRRSRVSTTAPFDKRTVTSRDGGSPFTAMMRPSANVVLRDRCSGTASATRGIKANMEYGTEDGAAKNATLRNSPSHQNTIAIKRPTPPKIIESLIPKMSKRSLESKRDTKSSPHARPARATCHQLSQPRFRKKKTAEPPRLQ
jgi:hypothetical protein